MNQRTTFQVCHHMLPRGSPLKAMAPAVMVQNGTMVLSPSFLGRSNGSLTPDHRVRVWPGQPKLMVQGPGSVILILLDLIPADVWHTLPSFQTRLSRSIRGQSVRKTSFMQLGDGVVTSYAVRSAAIQTRMGKASPSSWGLGFHSHLNSKNFLH